VATAASIFPSQHWLWELRIQCGETESDTNPSNMNALAVITGHRAAEPSFSYKNFRIAVGFVLLARLFRPPIGCLRKPTNGEGNVPAHFQSSYHLNRNFRRKWAHLAGRFSLHPRVATSLLAAP
jgi:hypothetical protein